MKHKDHYNGDYIFSFSQKIHSVMPDFDDKAFCHALTGRLDDKELFARLDCIVDAMQEKSGKTGGIRLIGVRTVKDAMDIIMRGNG